MKIQDVIFVIVVNFIGLLYFVSNLGYRFDFFAIKLLCIYICKHIVVSWKFAVGISYWQLFICLTLHILFLQ